MAIDPIIKIKANDIRNKVYGKEVRESLASGLEAMSSDVVENEGRQSVVEGRQDSVESQWQAVSDEMTDKDVISAPEIIAARNGEANLKTRLDEEHQEVTTQLAQTAKRLDDITFNIKDFGAIGDGITNDTVAFQNVSTAINNVGGGTLIIPYGDYLVGKQHYTPTGVYAWTGESILDLDGGNSIVIKGNNAKIKLEDDMRIGHFDRTTGEPLLFAENEDENTKNSFVNNLFNIKNYKNVEIENLEMDGQSESYIKGVLALRYEDGSYKSAERGAHGMELINCDSVRLSNLEVHHFGVDGAYIGNQIGEAMSYEYEDTPVLLTNCNFHHNGRQGLSWAGGKGLTAISCKFNHTGKAGIEYEPAAGVDVESNEGKVEDGFFLNCEFANNTIGVLSTGINRNLRFEKCRIFGTTGQSVRIYTPRTRFVDCFISGEITETGFADNEADKTKFIDCTITGESAYYDNPIFGARLFSERSTLTTPPYTSNPIFERCKLITGQKGLFNNATGPTITTLRDCHIIKNNTFGAALNVIFEGKNKIEDDGILLFTNSTNSGVIHYNGEVIEDEICNAGGVWQSRFRNYYFKGTDELKIPNYECSFTITAYQYDGTQSISIVGGKPGKGQHHRTTVLNSNELTLGHNNQHGAQIIDGFTDLTNARIHLQVFSKLP